MTSTHLTGWKKRLALFVLMMLLMLTGGQGQGLNAWAATATPATVPPHVHNFYYVRFKPTATEWDRGVAYKLAGGCNYDFRKGQTKKPKAGAAFFNNLALVGKKVGGTCTCQAMAQSLAKCSGVAYVNLVAKMKPCGGPVPLIPNDEFYAQGRQGNLGRAIDRDR